MKRLSFGVFFLVLSVAAGTLVYAEENGEKPKKVALPIVLNMVPGIGVGSFVQGDALGGFVGLGGEVVATGLVGYGLIVAYSGIIGEAFVAAITLGNAGDDVAEEELSRASVFILCGGILWVGTKIFEVVRPITYAKQYNRAHGLTTARISPILTPTYSDGEIALSPGLVLTLSY